MSSDAQPQRIPSSPQRIKDAFISAAQPPPGNLPEPQHVIVVQYRGKDIPIPIESSSTAALISTIAAATGTDPATIKLLPRSKGLPPISAATTTLPALSPGTRFLLMASTANAVRAVQNAADLPGMAGFDHEARVHAQRTAPVDDQSAPPQVPRTPYTFGRFATWSEPGLTLHPPEAEALKILHRLAADRGIRSVMERYRWSVGLLAEMPPEGKVGITPVCVLGYNVNAGQEIHLRLRTDDLAGFRAYNRIRETLVHELAHNAHADHDDRFKALNSELMKQVLAAQGGVGRTVAYM